MSDMYLLSYLDDMLQYQRILKKKGFGSGLMHTDQMNDKTEISVATNQMSILNL